MVRRVCSVPYWLPVLFCRSTPSHFLVITKNQVFGLPISPELRKQAEGAKLTPASFNLKPDQLNVVRIEPRQQEDGEEKMDVVSVVTTLEGKPLTSGHIASRLRGFTDIEQLERQGADNATLIESLLGDKNELHNNYQNFQAFLDAGGGTGLQHDVIRYGACNLNPISLSVRIGSML